MNEVVKELFGSLNVGARRMLERPSTALSSVQSTEQAGENRIRQRPGLAIQTVVFPIGQKNACSLDPVRQCLTSHPSAHRRQLRTNLETNAPSRKDSYDQINNSEMLSRICAASKVVLQFIRTARFGDSDLPISEGTEDVQACAALESAVEELELLKEQLHRENLALRDEVDQVSMFEEIVGTSPALQAVLSRVIKVAPTDSTVLITGETGTGKELIARAIHKKSQRAQRAFVSVNCAALPPALISSELFGHEKGAFTGATQQRLGRFELASGGTLFLDEVGELPAETQIALLRVLQEREFERVGGNTSIRANVRVIVATNRDLPAAIAAGTFREDLFYRLNVFPIEVPSLRERREDISLLVQYFIDRYARKEGKNIGRASKETLDLFQRYHWPGNIRELQNVIERSVIVSESGSFSVDESWLSRQPLRTAPTGQRGLRQRVVAEEKEAIEAALKESRGRVFGPTGAAARLGIARSTLESKIKTLKIDKNLFKVSNPSQENQGLEL
jgi:formate hydrogenlyase transcriptional activator